MHNIIIEEPYQFVPPKHGWFWPLISRPFISWHLRKTFGVTEVQFRGTENLKSSLAAKNGVLLTPNHCRPSDPFVLGLLAREIGVSPYIMASWHLFKQNTIQTWLLPRLRVFSVYREGLDSASVREASKILSQSRGPLVIFPEGLITRANDRLATLLDGPAFIARTAAKEKLKSGASRSGVVIHPIAIRYTFHGDIEAAVNPVLDEIESRLTWRVRSGSPILERINRIGEALLGLKELEYLGKVQSGAIFERIAAVTDCILRPLEDKWKIKRRAGDSRTGDIPNRVRALRAAIVPELTEGTLNESERTERWRELSDLYLAQQLALYPPDYIASKQSPERILETVERFEEDLTDRVRRHSPITATVTIGAAIPVNPEKEPKDGPTVTDKVRGELEKMLGINELPKEHSTV